MSHSAGASITVGTIWDGSVLDRSYRDLLKYLHQLRHQGCVDVLFNQGAGNSLPAKQMFLNAAAQHHATRIAVMIARLQFHERQFGQTLRFSRTFGRDITSPEREIGVEKLTSVAALAEFFSLEAARQMTTWIEEFRSRLVAVDGRGFELVWEHPGSNRGQSFLSIFLQQQLRR